MSRIPLAGGNPDFSIDGTSNYIPELFALRAQTKFYDNTVLSSISNTDFSGEITNKGDRVTIRVVPNINIVDYSKGGNIVLQRPEASSIEMSIDYAKAFNVALDDIDVKQMDMDWMSKFADDASQQLKIVVDTSVFAQIFSDVDATNSGATAGAKSAAFNLGVTGTPQSTTKINIVDQIVDLGTVMDENAIPGEGRWLVLPPQAAGNIKKSDLKDASLSGDSVSMLRNGFIGKIDRFNIFTSNLLTSVADGGTAYHVPFGHSSSLSFASQINKVQVYEHPDSFDTALKGLMVYGFKVVTPKAMGDLYTVFS